MIRVSRRRRAPLAAAVAALGATLVLAPAAGAAPAVPYTDPGAVGTIGLCDASGHQVTSGRLDTTPFVLHAVSSVAAQAPWNATGRTATLYAYQPRKGLAPGQWSGEQLTAGARYDDPAHPATAAVDNDLSLGEFVSYAPPSWDGFVQLRIYLGAPDTAPQTRTYPATDLQVTGDTWHAVDSGPVDCGGVKATSLTTILLPLVGASAPGVPGASATGAARATAAAPSGTGSGAANTGPSSAASAPAGSQPVHASASAAATVVPSTAPSAAAGADVASTEPAGSTHHNWPWFLLAAVALLLAGAGAPPLLRRLRPTASAPSALDPNAVPDPTPTVPEKGP